MDREAIKKQLTRLDKAASPGPAPPQATETQPLQTQVEALKEEMVQLGPVPEEEIEERNAGTGWGAVGWFLERTTFCTRTEDHSCFGNTSTRKCASAAARPCSHQCHKTVDQTRIRPRTSTEIRLSQFLRRTIVCPTLLSLPSHCSLPLRSALLLSGYDQGSISLLMDFQFGGFTAVWLRSSEYLFILGGSFCVAFSAFWLRIAGICSSEWDSSWLFGTHGILHAEPSSNLYSRDVRRNPPS